MSAAGAAGAATVCYRPAHCGCIGGASLPLLAPPAVTTRSASGASLTALKLHSNARWHFKLGEKIKEVTCYFMQRPPASPHAYLPNTSTGRSQFDDSYLNADNWSPSLMTAKDYSSLGFIGPFWFSPLSSCPCIEHPRSAFSTSSAGFQSQGSVEVCFSPALIWNDRKRRYFSLFGLFSWSYTSSPFSIPLWGCCDMRTPRQFIRPSLPGCSKHERWRERSEAVWEGGSADALLSEEKSGVTSAVRWETGQPQVHGLEWGYS